MNADEAKLLFHISKVVEKQSQSLESMQKEMHALSLRFVAIELNGQIVTPKEVKSTRIKDASLAGTMGGILASLLAAAVEWFKLKT